MGRRDLKTGEKYILIGHLLKKGVSLNLIDESMKILSNKKTLDSMIDELMNLVHKDDTKEKQNVLTNEIIPTKLPSTSEKQKKGTIVIAEKESYFTSLLKNESIARSYYLVHVENGIAGLKTIQKLMPSIAVIDFDTYSISEQYESIKIIRQQFKNIPILLLCNIIPDDLKMNINQHNQVSYIQKPITGRHLQEKIMNKIDV